MAANILGASVGTGLAVKQVQLAGQSYDQQREALSHEKSSFERLRERDLGWRDVDVEWRERELIRARRWREEDLEWRERERKLMRQWRHENLAWQAVEERAEQLKVVASQAGLLAGFALVAMVETTIPPNTDLVLVTCFGLCVAIVVILMLCAVVVSTLLLNAVFNFRRDSTCEEALAKHTLTVRTFEHFWTKRYEADFRFAFYCFECGIVAFLLLLILVGWVQFR